MPRSRTFRFLTIVPLLVVGMSQWACSADEWRSNFKSAWEEAQRTDRPVLLHFSATWCGPCQMMERSVLHSKETLQQIRAGFIAVKIDTDKHPELVQQFGIQALPSDVIIDPSGEVLSRSSGYQDRTNYIAKMGRIRSQIEQDRKIQIARTESTHPGLSTEESGRGSIDAPAPKQAQELVGLEGYSPVSLSKSRKWRRGLAEYAAEYQEIVYWMADSREYEEFRANPSQFAPKLLGCDPVVLWNTDKAIVGSTEYGAYFDGNLYLFSDIQTREQFKRDPIKYVRTRHVLRLDDVELTRLR